MLRLWEDVEFLAPIHPMRVAEHAEFLEHVKIDLFPEAVYVFTPKSRILALPRGATPVDYAYAIHSDVGDHCVAASVNGEAVALRTELKSGDVVEITTAPGGTSASSSTNTAPRPRSSSTTWRLWTISCRT